MGSYTIRPALCRWMHTCDMLRERHLSLKLRHTEIRISLLFFAVLVVLFTVDQTSIPQWCLVASAMHEAGHFVFLLAYRCQPSLISVGLFGVRVEQKPTSRLSYLQNFWVSLAGPLVNLISFVVLFAATGWSKAAIVHLVIAVINLLPVESLDGGQALFCLLANRMNSQKPSELSLPFPS